MMKHTFFEARGDIILSSQLKLPKACDLALALETGSLAYAWLIECRRTSEDEEVVVFEVDVEVPQLKVHEIHPQERISVTFEVQDKITPKAEALRCDFPQVPHLNLHLQEFPRNLCLYADRYEEVKRRWTPARLVQRIREWLALTAKGELHQADQPLEPVLLNFWGHIIIPGDLRPAAAGSLPDRLYVTKPPFATEDTPFLIAQRNAPAEGLAPLVVSVHCCLPHVHGIINRYPATLADLAEMVRTTGLELIEELRARLKRWHSENQSLPDYHVLVLILFPRTRIQGGTEERVDPWTFWLDASLHAIGSKLGVWQKQDGKLGLILSTELSSNGADIGLAVLNTSYELTSSMAASLNGQRDCHDINMVAIGVGSLGSQVVMNLARSGFGSWTLIDNDLVMPHNLARHVLYGPFIGGPKVDGVAFLADSILPGASLFATLKTDVLTPGTQGQALADILQKANSIIDLSASMAVARKLALDTNSAARRLSLFLTPVGNDLVLLSEDRNRTAALDSLEMQYYRCVLSDERLKGHLRPREGQQRYAQTCRDVTYTLPHNRVALLAAIGATAIQEVIDRSSACISIWRCDSAQNVQHIDVTPRPVIRHNTSGWNIVTDVGLLEKLYALRDARLPNETGGILLGSFDMERHLVYIVDSISSPADSKEWPTLYVRGCQGLRLAVDEAVEKTNGMVEYIGEWHSHPRRASTAPSNDDLQVFAWLTELMDNDGLPAVMMIVGDPGRLSCFVGEIDRKENCFPQGASLA